MTDEEKELKKKEALRDYNLAKNDLKKRKNKKLKILLILFSIVLVILVVIRIIFGRLYFSLPYMYYNKSNEYMFYVNGEHQNIGFEDYDDTPVIPGVLYFRRINMGGWYNVRIYDQELIFNEEKVVFNFDVYECYTHTDEVRINCDSFNEKFIRKEVKPKFTRLFIRKNGRREKIMYDGEYISDISQYVKEKGYYYIEIWTEYDGVETKLYLTPRRKESLDENNNL